MGKINLLDCTLRDGGYINDWLFGEEAIRNTVSKLAETGIEMIEIGFIKGESYNPNKSVFPDIDSFKRILKNKRNNVVYLGMIDMQAPVPIERITPYDGDSIDGIRVIFKKDKLEEAYRYVELIKKLGYKVFANFVNTDAYSDMEFISGIEKFNRLMPFGVAIVDTFGTIKKRDFRRLVDLADHNLKEGIMLCYHAHNNLQQAFGNAECLVEMNLKRSVCVDACVFGMGRGAGNLNLELFAEYMNENFGTDYKIAPMLYIMDEYLAEFYRTKFWGYSLPLYLSAIHGCHPNYAIYLAEKNTLSVRAFDELLQSIDLNDRLVFSKDKAENYYKTFFQSHIDDSSVLFELTKEFKNKKIILLAPGKSLNKYENDIFKEIRNSKDTCVVSINYFDEKFKSDYVFVSNMRRYKRIVSRKKTKVIATSNIESTSEADYVVNYLSYVGKIPEVFDNAGLMAIRFLCAVGTKELFIAGMDGYSSNIGDNYFFRNFETDHLSNPDKRNILIANELRSISDKCDLHFITPSLYKLN